MTQDQNSDPKSSSTMDSNNTFMPSDESNQQQMLHSAPTTFSIATPTVTTILPMTENMNDIPFLLPATSYKQDALIVGKSDDHLDSIKTTEAQDNASTTETQSQQNFDSNLADKTIANSTETTTKPVEQSGEGSKVYKKRNKATKKSIKLDAKSKLEKSRQSARECRARKKLRYQYLEDLVCNREKAVVKLREELSMFCELSKQVETGVISDNDRRLLVDQTKEIS